MTDVMSWRHRRAATYSRRAVLAGMAALGLTACLPGTWRGIGQVHGFGDPGGGEDLPDGLFALGVASGDPAPDSVVLWTRIAPDPLNGGGIPAAVEVPVRWQVATDPAMTDLVADGIVVTKAEVAHSVHIIVEGLAPATTYYYQFAAGDERSPVGRTRTAPALGAEVDRLRMAVATCQNYTQGYYHAWSQVVADDPDLVVFLGDYIYEGGFTTSGVRNHNSPEVMTLDAYRNRYALYKLDPNLQAAHAALPWVITWDDHEVENNHAGLIPQDRADDPIFVDRRTAAYRAFWEHQPLRAEPEGINLTMHRAVRWGALMDILVVDGRQYRSDQPCAADVSADCPARTDPSRTMLGADQLAWLESELAASTARWSVMGNQTAMTPMPFGTAFNTDQWDGYAAERTRLLGALAAVRNAVVLTGDFHAGGVGRLCDEAPGSPVIGTELMTTSVSSRESNADLLNTIVRTLPQWPYFEAGKRGYLRCEVTPDRFDADFVVVNALSPTPGPASIDSSWSVLDGTPGPVAR